MGIVFLVFLAIIWGMFGLFGFLRGWRAALLSTVLIVGTLLVLSIAPEKIKEIFDYVNQAAAMITGDSKPVIDTSPAGLTPILLTGAVIFGFFLGLLRIFRTQPSFMGFLLGFINGYLYTAYMLAALVPTRAILPLPIKIPGLSTVSLTAAAAAPPSTGLIGTFISWLDAALKMACAPTAIVAGIILFILLAILLGNKGSKKG